MAEAVILAAGKSSRAGTCKLALEIDGVPLIRHTINAFSRDCSRIIVVLGHNREKIASLLPVDGSIIQVVNEQYEKGMFSSVQRGAAETAEDFLVCPGDIPGFSPDTVRTLINGEGQIRIPGYRGKSGHPVYFSRKLKDALLAAPVETSLREFIAAVSCSGNSSVKNTFINTLIDTEDRGILKDIDTMTDYQRFIAKKNNKGECHETE